MTDTTPRYRSLSCEDMDDSMAYRLLTSLIVPRPIAWVCTLEESGSVNLAPFSSFNYGAHSPPMLAININRNEDGSLKDTARNLQANKECVVQLCRQSDLAAVHASAAALPPGQSEVKELGMNLVPSQHVCVPRLDGAWFVQLIGREGESRSGGVSAFGSVGWAVLLRAGRDFSALTSMMGRCEPSAVRFWWTTRAGPQQRTLRG